MRYRLQTTLGLAATVMMTSALAVMGPAKAAEPVKPAVGDCFTFTLAQYSDDDESWPDLMPKSSCDESHNVEVVKVLPVPAKFAKFGRDSMPVLAFGSNECVAAVGKRTGRQPSLSFLPSWFVAGSSRWKAGDRYVVCAGATQRKVGKKTEMSDRRGAYTRGDLQPICANYSKRSGWRWYNSCNGTEYLANGLGTLGYKDSETKKFPGEAAVRAKIEKMAKGRGWSSPATSKKGWNDGDRWVIFYMRGPSGRV